MKDVLKIILSLALSIIVVISIFYFIAFLEPTKAEVDRYFEENKCIYCSGDAYGRVYQMRRNTAMFGGQIFNIPWWYIFPDFTLYITTPFNYYHETNHNDDEFSTYTWIDTRDGRLVYNALSGEFIKEIDSTIDPGRRYFEDQKILLEQMKNS